MDNLEDFEFSEDRLLLVEGLDDSNFFRSFCNHLGNSNVQVQDFGGKDRLSSFLRTLVGLPNFEFLKNLGIVRDADDSASSSRHSIETALKQANLPSPDDASSVPSVSVMVMPPSQDSGCLESLLWEYVSLYDAELAACIDEFVDCAGLPDTDTRIEKARVHAYIASRDRPGLKIGEAARRGYWDFDHLVFDPIKTFLTELAS